MITFQDKGKIRRVFFHELGHYISAKLNQKYYTGFGSEYIKIYPCENKFDEFCGKTEPNIPADYDNSNIFWERIAEALISSIYGCIFQSYFSNSSTLDFCFEHFGVDDMFKHNGIIANHRLGHYKNFQLNQLYNRHYQEIFTNNILDELRTIDYLALLIPIENEFDSFFVNLIELDNDLKEFVENYCDFYQKFVDDVRKIIIEK